MKHQSVIKNILKMSAIGVSLSATTTWSHNEKLVLDPDAVEKRITTVDGMGAFTCYAARGDISGSKWFINNNEIKESSRTAIVDFIETPVGNLGAMTMRYIPVELNNSRVICEGTFESGNKQSKSTTVVLQAELLGPGNVKGSTEQILYISVINNDEMPGSGMSVNSPEQRSRSTDSIDEMLLEPERDPDTDTQEVPVQLHFTWEAPFHFKLLSVCPVIAYRIDIIHEGSQEQDPESYGSGSGQESPNTSHPPYKRIPYESCPGTSYSHQVTCSYRNHLSTVNRDTIESLWTLETEFHHQLDLKPETILSNRYRIKITPVSYSSGNTGEPYETTLRELIPVEQFEVIRQQNFNGYEWLYQAKLPDLQNGNRTLSLLNNRNEPLPVTDLSNSIDDEEAIKFSVPASAMGRNQRWIQAISASDCPV